MQAIARENNLSETAFLIAKDASVLDSNTCAYKKYVGLRPTERSISVAMQL